MLSLAGRGQLSQGGQGKACWVELGHGGARRSRHGTLWYDALRCVQLRLGGQGAARRVKFWSVGVRSGESRLI